MMSKLICPECGKPMVLRRTSRYTYPNGEPSRFWGCSAYPLCTATHGAHPDGTPLGTPANSETKQARIAAHAAFDRLWKEGPFSRREAYQELARLTGLSTDDAHIGKFDKPACERLIALLQQHNPVNSKR